MRLRDYLDTYAAPASAVAIRGVAEWLEMEAKLPPREPTADAAVRIRAAAFERAAAELRDETLTWDVS